MPLTDQERRCVEVAASYLGQRHGGLWPVPDGPTLADIDPSWSARSSVGVVLASRGYPGTYQSGFPIDGLGTLERDVFAFHAGTIAGSGGYTTAGGRVLTLVALGDSMAEARDRAYRNADRIRFQGMTFRHDLALREVEAPVLP